MSGRRLERAIYWASAKGVRPVAAARHLDCVEGLEHLPSTGAFVVVANHSSFADHFLLEGPIYAVRGRRTYFLTKEESFATPLKALWHRSVGGIPVARSRPLPETLRQISQVLRRGEVLCVYPEGTRGPGWPLLPFQSGAFRFATREDVPVIPVAIAGAHLILPKGARWPRAVRARLVFGPPLPAHAELPRPERVAALTRAAEEAVTALLQQAQTHAAGPSEAASQMARIAERLIDAMHDETDDLPSAQRLRQLRFLLDQAGRMDPAHIEVEVQRLRVLGLRALAARLPRRLWLAYPIRRRARRVLRRAPGHAMANYVLGRWHLGMPGIAGGRRSLAVEHLRRAAESEPDDFRYPLSLAEALARVGAREEADAVLDRLFQRCGPAAPDARTSRRLRRAAELRTRLAAGALFPTVLEVK